MRLFYKKKTVKPTEKELNKITARLMAKYPQMYEEPYVPGNVPIKKQAGDTNLSKMVAKRLKRKYRS